MTWQSDWPAICAFSAILIGTLVALLSGALGEPPWRRWRP